MGFVIHSALPFKVWSRIKVYDASASAIKVKVSVAQSCPTLQPHASLLSASDSPGKSTGVGCHSLLQGIFLTQGSSLGLPHCRQILYSLESLEEATFNQNRLSETLSTKSKHVGIRS